jgi:hypothetical protein
LKDVPARLLAITCSGARNSFQEVCSAIFDIL